MTLGTVARELASQASTSGRSAVSEMLGRASPALFVVFQRNYSLVGSGIPSPRADVALQLSTPHGGHINRMINTSESIAELDSILYRFRKRLRPANIGSAAMRLEHLHRYERRAPYALKVQRVAAELQKYVETYTDRLALTQVANVLRGMSAVRYRLPPDLLLRLAAGVAADNCAALRYAPDVDVRDLCFGLAGQGYTNALLWSRLCASVLPRLPSFDPNTLPAIVTALHTAQQLTLSTAPTPATAARTPRACGGAAAAPAPALLGSTPQMAVAHEALRLLMLGGGGSGGGGGGLESLRPARLADAAQLLAALGPQLGVASDAELVTRLQAVTLRSLPSLSPTQLPSLLLSLSTLRRAAAATPPHLPLDLLAAAAPHLRAAAPDMDLQAVQRAVKALAPTMVVAFPDAAAVVVPLGADAVEAPLDTAAVAAPPDSDAVAAPPDAAAVAAPPDAAAVAVPPDGAAVAALPDAAAVAAAPDVDAVAAPPDAAAVAAPQDAAAVAAAPDAAAVAAPQDAAAVAAAPDADAVAAAKDAAAVVGPLLEVLARRATMLLPSLEGSGSSSGSGGDALLRVPRGGKGTGAVLVAAVGPGVVATAALDARTMGLVEGLARAYVVALGGSEQDKKVRKKKWNQMYKTYPGVAALLNQMSALEEASAARRPVLGAGAAAAAAQR